MWSSKERKNLSKKSWKRAISTSISSSYLITTSNMTLRNITLCYLSITLEFEVWHYLIYLNCNLRRLDLHLIQRLYQFQWIKHHLGIFLDHLLLSSHKIKVIFRFLIVLRILLEMNSWRDSSTEALWNMRRHKPQTTIDTLRITTFLMKKMHRVLTINI